ncbi:glycosyltransferase family 4 protein [Fodinicola acaciae]|uniref:glycosyltransferase family 4 protein n=1 Tax=Fodinicola acaciae TaxID=2681555 RepID=UPI0013D69A4D|nr:glycosyltransferase family 4 protein [Fodinicola acaciae]
MRVGLVCPYSLDVPGGVQSHVSGLADALIARGHQVSVLAPATDLHRLPAYVVPAGRSVPVRYNGSVARLALNPVTLGRVRRWLRAGVGGRPFDVLHVHEPFAPSLSLLACLVARGPIVATFHTSMDRSRALAAAQGFLQPVLERIAGRIAVSPSARRVQVEHLAGGGVEIPNGVDVAALAGASPLPGWPGPGGALGFLGRFGEPRKGFAVLAEAYARLAERRPDLRLLVAGPGRPEDALAMLPSDRGRVQVLSVISDAERARMLRSVDVFVAPNVGAESFGIVLTEAMAAGAPVVASDLDAFRRVLADGAGGVAGRLFRAGDAGDLAAALDRLLDAPQERAALALRASAVVAGYDWSAVAARVIEVYELVAATIDEVAAGAVVDLPVFDSSVATGAPP